MDAGTAITALIILIMLTYLGILGFKIFKNLDVFKENSESLLKNPDFWNPFCCFDISLLVNISDPLGGDDDDDGGDVPIVETTEEGRCTREEYENDTGIEIGDDYAPRVSMYVKTNGVCDNYYCDYGYSKRQNGTGCNNDFDEQAYEQLEDEQEQLGNSGDICNPTDADYDSYAPEPDPIMGWEPYDSEKMIFKTQNGKCVLKRCSVGYSKMQTNNDKYYCSDDTWNKCTKDEFLEALSLPPGTDDGHSGARYSNWGDYYSKDNYGRCLKIRSGACIPEYGLYQNVPERSSYSEGSGKLINPNNYYYCGPALETPEFRTYLTQEIFDNVIEDFKNAVTNFITDITNTINGTDDDYFLPNPLNPDSPLALHDNIAAHFRQMLIYGDVDEYDDFYTKFINVRNNLQNRANDIITSYNRSVDAINEGIRASFRAFGALSINLDSDIGILNMLRTLITGKLESINLQNSDFDVLYGIGMLDQCNGFVPMNLINTDTKVDLFEMLKRINVNFFNDDNTEPNINGDFDMDFLSILFYKNLGKYTICEDANVIDVSYFVDKPVYQIVEDYITLSSSSYTYKAAELVVKQIYFFNSKYNYLDDDVFDRDTVREAVEGNFWRNKVSFIISVDDNDSKDNRFYSVYAWITNDDNDPYAKTPNDGELYQEFNNLNYVNYFGIEITWEWSGGIRGSRTKDYTKINKINNLVDVDMAIDAEHDDNPGGYQHVRDRFSRDGNCAYVIMKKGRNFKKYMLATNSDTMDEIIDQMSSSNKYKLYGNRMNSFILALSPDNKLRIVGENRDLDYGITVAPLQDSGSWNDNIVQSNANKNINDSIDVNTVASNEIWNEHRDQDGWHNDHNLHVFFGERLNTGSPILTAALGANGGMPDYIKERTKLLFGAGIQNYIDSKIGTGISLNSLDTSLFWFSGSGNCNGGVQTVESVFLLPPDKVET